MNLISGAPCAPCTFSLSPDRTEADEVGRGQTRGPSERAGESELILIILDTYADLALG